MGYRQFSKIMLLALGGWAALLLLLSVIFRIGPRRGTERFEPEVPVYEEGFDLRERRSEVIGWHNIVYQVSLEYPSLAVYRFCERELRRKGWVREYPMQELPIWRPSRAGDKRHWVARAQWRDKNGVYRIQLELMSTERVREELPGEVVSESREPGITVSCTASRIMLPVEGK